MTPTVLTQAQYDAAYMASLPPAIVKAMAIPNFSQRQTQLVNLAENGSLIDDDIMLWLEDPALVNQMRYNDGYTWVPSLLQQPILSAPGKQPSPGIPAYNPNSPPQGSIMVYWPSPPPPITPPPPPAPPPTFVVVEPIGSQYPNFYEVSPDGPSVAVGTSFEQGAFEYTKEIIGQSPFAPNGNITGWKQTPVRAS